MSWVVAEDSDEQCAMAGQASERRPRNGRRGVTGTARGASSSRTRKCVPNMGARKAHGRAQAGRTDDMIRLAKGPGRARRGQGRRRGLFGRGMPASCDEGHCEFSYEYACWQRALSWWTDRIDGDGGDGSRAWRGRSGTGYPAGRRPCSAVASTLCFGWCSSVRVLVRPRWQTIEVNNQKGR